MMEDTRWLFFVAGGIIGAVLVLAIFEFALIILSSVVGASMISQNFELSGWLLTAAFLLLVLVGILIQWATLRNEGKRVKST
jgi:hypothetical protein